MQFCPHLEHKFARFGSDLRIAEAADDTVEITGYASLFGRPDQGGDVVRPGAYAASLKDRAALGSSVKMLWQHDPAQPIGVWDEITEDSRGLHVKGRILTRTHKGAEAAALIAAGALDGLSIGYRTRKSSPRPGGGRELCEVDLWEVSLVTFPMLPSARLNRTGTQQKAAPQGARQTTEPDPREARLWLEICELLRGACTGTTRAQPG